MFRCIEFQEQHDKNSMVGKLLKLTLPNIVILQENSHYYTEDLYSNRLELVNHESNLLSTVKLFLPLIKLRIRGKAIYHVNTAKGAHKLI